MRGVLGRAASVPGSPHVSMQCTFSTDIATESSGLPERSDDVDDWCTPPPRTACQFAVYPLGTPADNAAIVEAALAAKAARDSPAFEAERPLCTMLDGAGEEVFAVLRRCFVEVKCHSHCGCRRCHICCPHCFPSVSTTLPSSKACERRVSSSATVVMTATLTANKASWKSEEQKQLDSRTLAAAQVEATQALLLGRRTINEFEPSLPQGWEQAIERAVEAATFAPNHRRTEPWRFHLLGPLRVRNVCELNAAMVAESKGAEAGEKKLKRWLAMPGWLVVTHALPETAERGGDDVPNGVAREDYAAVCCAVQNLCLSLHAQGLGTKWTTGDVNFDPRFASAVGLPENEQVRALRDSKLCGGAVQLDT